MFGRNRVSMEEVQRMQEELEQTSEIVLQFAEKKAYLDGSITDISETRRRMATDLTQVQENTRSASELAQQNIDEIAAMSHAITQSQGKMRQWESECNSIREQVQNQLQQSMELVEGNKHFTTPAKNISETASFLRDKNQTFMAELTSMGEYGKEMGVLALNAAIEAGRLGEAGRQFILAAEQVRTCAGKYEASVQTLKNQVEASDQKIQELEEQVHHMVSLLKENNIETNKFMKLCSHTAKQVEKTADYAFVSEMADLKAKVTGIRNSEEEILKVEERNMLQMADIMEEYQVQEKDSKEIAEALQWLLTDAMEYKNMKEG